MTSSTCLHGRGQLGNHACLELRGALTQASAHESNACPAEAKRRTGDTRGHCQEDIVRISACSKSTY